jgi:uncharacterized membrane protein YeiH
VWTAAVALAGAVLYVALADLTDLQNGVIAVITVVVVFALRMAAVRWRLRTHAAADYSDRVFSFWSRADGDDP